jgi:predicted RNA-binding protein with PUA-like domain
MANQLKTTGLWLMKSEPDVFSIDDLKMKKTSLWDGVRNYMARNFMMNDMKVGDQVLFYHSNAEPPGVAGLAEVSALATPDPGQFDKKSEYYDPKSTQDKPRWFCVTVGYKAHLPRLVSLQELKSHPKLKNMVLFTYNRLSIAPVTKEEFQVICSISEKKS